LKGRTVKELKFERCTTDVSDQDVHVQIISPE